MIIRQIRLNKMQIFCYLVGDESTKTCTLIDPAFETNRILDIVNKEGYTVTHVINTHGHSDHTAGNAAIIESTNAKLLIHKNDAKQLDRLFNRAINRMLGGKKSPAPDRLLEDGDIIKIGNTELKVIHTPGHSKGSICLSMDDHIFTGDTLFVGGVGRTDLPGGSFKQLSKSVQEKIYILPDDTRVWPGHDYGQAPYSTVANEKMTNII